MTVAGYGIGAATGFLLILLLSANSHDKSMEMTMTAFFVSGPISTVIGFVIALMWKNASGAK